MSARTAVGLFGLGKELNNRRILHDILIVSNQSLIPKARSDMANYFLNATDFESLLWIDADLGFVAEDVLKLMELDVDHAMATYPHKSQDTRYSFTLELDKQNNIQWNDEKTACKITKNVGGFSLIHRSVFIRLAKAHPELKYNPASTSRTVTERELNNSYHFYDTPISNTDGSIMPEDFAFHEKCRKIGIDLWLRTDVQLIHNGNTDFAGTNLDSILKGV
jgi:hypothetical protein